MGNVRDVDAERIAVRRLLDRDRVVQVFCFRPVDGKDRTAAQVQPPCQFFRRDPPAGEEVGLRRRFGREFRLDAGGRQDRRRAVFRLVPVAVPPRQFRLIVPVALPPADDLNQHPFPVQRLFAAGQGQFPFPAVRQGDHRLPPEPVDDAGVKGAAHFEDTEHFPALRMAARLFLYRQLNLVPRQRPPQFGAWHKDISLLPVLFQPDKAEGGL